MAVPKNNSTVSILLGNGDGTFGPPASYAVGGVPSSLAVGDFNGDQNKDLAVATAGNLSVLLGNGDGTFQAAQNFPVGNEVWVTVGDFNRDGKTDVVMSDSAANIVSVLMGNGDGTFQTPLNLFVGPFPSVLRTADVNGDGIPDLVVGNQLGVAILLGSP